MKIRRIVAGFAAALVAPSLAAAYPGGTPDYQTDAAPFCAGCHSSRNAEMLAGSGERAEKEVAESKHIAVILSGQKGYESLTEADRKTLADQIRALDVASSVVLEAPDSVAPGQTFAVTVKLTGGAGPVVGVMLVDRAHRWYARPATSAGWQVVAPPRISVAGGAPQTDWLQRRPETAGRNLGFVNVSGIESDAAAGRWASAQVTFTLRAPTTPGEVPLAAAFLYGTEKASLLGYTTDAMGRKKVRGGTAGGSGRVLFTPVKQIRVAVPAPAPPEAPPPKPAAAPPKQPAPATPPSGEKPPPEAGAPDAPKGAL